MPEASLERSPQEQVMAALAVAEQMTKAETPIDGAYETKPASAGDDNAAPPTDGHPLVALLISRPDVKSVSALQGLNIAIGSAQASVEEDIRSGLAAAGAADIRLSLGDTAPFDRLVSGDVQAAVLERVSADAAEAFPEIKGFKVLRVPLLPR
jgi:hypothetical protein